MIHAFHDPVQLKDKNETASQLAFIYLFTININKRHISASSCLHACTPYTNIRISNFSVLCSKLIFRSQFLSILYSIHFLHIVASYSYTLAFLKIKSKQKMPLPFRSQGGFQKDSVLEDIKTRGVYGRERVNYYFLFQVFIKGSNFIFVNSSGNRYQDKTRITACKLVTYIH